MSGMIIISNRSKETTYWISTLHTLNDKSQQVCRNYIDDEINHYTVGHVGSESGQKDQLQVAIHHSLSMNGIASG